MTTKMVSDSTGRPLTKAEERHMEILRAKVVKDYPYLSYVVFRLKPYIKEIYIDGEHMPTMSVDGRARLFIDPAIFGNEDNGFEGIWDVGEQAGALIHEINHILRDHSTRMVQYFGKTLSTEPQNQYFWNIMADAEINDDIEEMFPSANNNNRFTVRLPCQVVTPTSLGFADGHTAEQYGNMMNQINPPQQNSGSGGNSDQSSGDSDGSDSDGDGDDSSGSEGNSDSRIKDILGDGHGGSFCSSNHDPGNEGNSDLPGLDPTEVDAIREITSQDIVKHAESGRGNVPAGLVELAKFNLRPPVTDWRKILRSKFKGALVNSMKIDYSYRKVNRRAENHEIAPGLVGYLPKVHVYVDTSGSMSMEEDITYAVSEIEGLSRKMGIKGDMLKVSCVDAASYASRRWNGADKFVVEGRGGTDMRIAYQEVADMRRKDRPDIMVLVTDGGTPWPEYDQIPGVKKLALITRAGAEKFVPSWIESVVIN